jgi:hypothetical protein
MIVHRSPLPDLDIPEIPITDYVLKEAARVPDRPALIDGPTGRTSPTASCRARSVPSPAACGPAGWAWATPSR